MFLASEDTISLAHTHSPVERYEKLKDYESDHIHIKKKQNATRGERNRYEPSSPFLAVNTISLEFITFFIKKKLKKRNPTSVTQSSQERDG